MVPYALDNPLGRAGNPERAAGRRTGFIRRPAEFRGRDRKCRRLRFFRYFRFFRCFRRLLLRRRGLHHVDGYAAAGLAAVRGCHHGAAHADSLASTARSRHRGRVAARQAETVVDKVDVVVFPDDTHAPALAAAHFDFFAVPQPTAVFAQHGEFDLVDAPVAQRQAGIGGHRNPVVSIGGMHLRRAVRPAGRETAIAVAGHQAVRTPLRLAGHDLLRPVFQGNRRGITRLEAAGEDFLRGRTDAQAHRPGRIDDRRLHAGRLRRIAFGIRGRDEILGRIAQARQIVEFIVVGVDRGSQIDVGRCGAAVGPVDRHGTAAGIAGIGIRRMGVIVAVQEKTPRHVTRPSAILAHFDFNAVMVYGVHIDLHVGRGGVVLGIAAVREVFTAAAGQVDLVRIHTDALQGGVGRDGPVGRDGRAVLGIGELDVRLTPLGFGAQGAVADVFHDVFVVDGPDHVGGIHIELAAQARIRHFHGESHRPAAGQQPLRRTRGHDQRGRNPADDERGGGRMAAVEGFHPDGAALRSDAGRRRQAQLVAVQGSAPGAPCRNHAGLDQGIIGFYCIFQARRRTDDGFFHRTAGREQDGLMGKGQGAGIREGTRLQFPVMAVTRYACVGQLQGHRMGLVADHVEIVGGILAQAEAAGQVARQRAAVRHPERSGDLDVAGIGVGGDVRRNLVPGASSCRQQGAQAVFKRII